MFFVLMWKNSPSGCMHMIATIKKMIYDAFK